jgi:hypothetical protein
MFPSNPLVYLVEAARYCSLERSDVLEKKPNSLDPEIVAESSSIAFDTKIITS